MTDENQNTFELLELKPNTISLEDIFLDPNNPRFSKDLKKLFPESRVQEEKIQVNLKAKIIKEIGIEDLVESIQINGFSVMDRVILKAIEGEKYIVLEGNRRIACLKYLKELHENGELSLPEQVFKSICKFDVLIYTGYRPDIAWIIQGLRHLTGVKNWPRFNQAKFIVENFVEKKKLGYREIGMMLSIKVPDVGKIVRSYYAFNQSAKHKEYGLKTDKFSMFQEGVFQKDPLKKWLGWKDSKNAFTNDENYNKFLKWLTEDKEDQPKITRAIDVRDILSKLVLDENRNIMQRFENGNITISEAKTKIDKKETRNEIEHKSVNIDDAVDNVESLYKKLSTLPMPQILKNIEAKAKLKDIFDGITEVISTYRPLMSK